MSTLRSMHWSANDRIGFEAGDKNLYRYVGNSPTNALDPSGLQQFDLKMFEEFLGLDKALTRGKETLIKLKDEAIVTEAFSATDCLGKKGFDVTFKFDEVHVGTFPYKPAKDRLQQTAYVKLSASIPKESITKGGEFQTLYFVQVIRSVSLKLFSDPAFEVVEPDTPLMRLRGGWDNEKASSRGWYVDTMTTAKHSYYPFQQYGSATKDGSQPVRLWDPVGAGWADQDNKFKGRELYTCLVGIANGKKPVIIASLHWAFVVGSDGKSIYMFPPKTTTTVPGPVKDAIDRWNGIKGNVPAEIDFPK